jgi:hypothetical protein
MADIRRWRHRVTSLQLLYTFYSASLDVHIGPLEYIYLATCDSSLPWK